MNTNIRAAAVAAAAASAAAALALAPGASAANYVAGCQLSGTANFDNSGLQGAGLYSPFTYSFDGALTGCQSSDGAPSSGTVFAGEQGLKHTSGAGSCAESVSNGEAVVKWADGHYTVLQYATQGALAAVELSGTVVQETVERVPVLDVNGNPTGQTKPLFSTDETATAVGSTVGGALAFSVADPSQCANLVTGGVAVTQAAISGVIGEGEGPAPAPAPPAPPQIPDVKIPIDPPGV